jgi:hypothetical protein
MVRTLARSASTHVYFNFNLKDGLVVLDIPPTVGAGLFGSLLDAGKCRWSMSVPLGRTEARAGPDKALFDKTWRLADFERVEE